MTWALRNDVTALAATLDAERDALLAGTLDRLEPLVRRKERLVQGLAQSTDSVRDDVQRRDAIRREIVPRLERNRALLEAAGAGLQAAMARLHPRPPESFGTYGADGRRAQDADGGADARGGLSAPRTGPRMERRA